jgi:hypothetical protein
MIVFAKQSSMAESAEIKTDNKADIKSRRERFISGVYHYAVAWFLGALALMFIITPLIEKLDYGDHIVSAALTVVLLFAVLAVGNRRATLILAILLVIPAVTAKWISHFRPDLVAPEYWLIPGLLFVAFVIMHLFGFILRAPHVDSEILCAGIAGYLMLALLWSFCYTLLADLIPGSFVFTVGPASAHAMKGFTALYFSFVTLCTVGYGDIVPVSGFARSVAMMEAAVGVFYVATVISRLVAIYSSEKLTNHKPP